MINAISPAKHAQRAELAALMANYQAPITILPAHEPVQRSPHKAPSNPTPKRSSTHNRVKDGEQRTRKIRELREKGFTYRQIGAELGLAEASIRSWMRVHGDSDE